MSLVLLGGGGHASDVLSVIEARAVTEDGFPNGPIYVADDAWQQPERFEGRLVDVKLVESIEAGLTLGRHVVALGYPTGRRAVACMAARAGHVASDPLVHPHVSIGANLDAGPGVVVMGQTWLSPRVTLGTHTHVGYGATIGHDTSIGSWCSVMPGACIGGDVSIGNGVLIGAGATILQGLVIGDDAVVGAGATVVRNVEPATTVVGTPAQPQNCFFSG